MLLGLFFESTAQVNLTNGLVAYYPFNGNPNDISGNNRNGQLVNGPVLTTDRFGSFNSAYYFDGINDYIKVGDDGGFSTPNFSLAFWFQTESDALQNLIGKRDFTGGNNGAQYQFFINYSPYPGIGSNVIGNTSSCTSISSSSYTNTGDIICKNKWYFAVVVLEPFGTGVRHKIYIDGVLKKTITSSFTGMLTTCKSDLRFGNWWSGDLIPFKGKMDDIRWYNRPLNDAEIMALFDNFSSSSADFSYSQNACAPKTIQYNNLTPNTTSIYWDFGNSTTNTVSQGPTVTYANYGSYPVKLRVQTSSGCIDSVTKVIPVNLLQDSLITIADTTLCKGSSIQLNTLPGVSFCWGTSTGLSNAAVANPVASPSNTTTYYLTSQATGTNLVVNGDFSAGNTGFFSDYTAAFPNNTDAQYWVASNPQSWNGGFSNCNDHSSGNGNMMMVNGSTALNAIVWQETIAISPNTNYALSAWVSSLYTVSPANLRFSINGKVLGNNITASSTTCTWNQFFTTWNSGNNTSAVIAIVNNNNAFNGNDFALDDISFAPVLMKQDSIKITVVDPPSLTITPNTAICPGDTLPLTASGAAVYTWSPATGLSGNNISNPLASPGSTTKYIVSAYVQPGCSVKDSVTVTVKPRPVISKSNDTAFCMGATPVTIAASSPGALQYSWSPATGLSNPSVSNPVANPAVTSTYHIQVTGANGCKASDSVKVSVLAVPTVDTRPDTTICNGTGTILSTSSSGATGFSWLPVTGLSDPSVASPIASPSSATKYIITVSNGACSARDSVTINIIPAPVITKSNDTTICNQGLAQLAASGGTGYTWSPSAGLSNTGIPNPTASPAAPTRYYVTVTGANGCNKTDSINIGWVPKPVFAISPSAVAICNNDSTILTASGADTYNWFSGTAITNPAAAATAVKPASTQQYSVAVRHNFCKLNDTLKATVTVNSLPVTSVKKSNDIDCSNASATLTATGGISYSWTPAVNINGATTATAVVTPAVTTTYKVRVTNSSGCTKYDSVSVNVAFNPATGGYYMADAFTPNNDGKNDCFGLKYWGGVQDLDFSIYNRWGERVFHGSNIAACWDGSWKGIPQASGTFVYIIKAKTACGEIFKKGTVALIR